MIEVRPIKDKTQAREGEVVIVVFRDKRIPKTRYNIGKAAQEVVIKEEYQREMTCSSLYDFYFHLWGFDHSLDSMVAYHVE